MKVVKIDDDNQVRVFLKDGSVLYLPLANVLMCLINDSGNHEVVVMNAWANRDGAKFTYNERVTRDEPG